MRTITMTFTFTEEEWRSLQKCAIRDGKQPTWGEVTNEIKILALRHAKCLDDVEKQLDAMATKEEPKYAN